MRQDFHASEGFLVKSRARLFQKGFLFLTRYPKGFVPRRFSFFFINLLLRSIGFFALEVPSHLPRNFSDPRYPPRTTHNRRLPAREWIAFRRHSTGTRAAGEAPPGCKRDSAFPLTGRLF